MSPPPPRGPGSHGPSGPIETFSAGVPRDRLVEDTRFGELYVLFIINLLLGLLTFGIYRFWGKTRIRKYVWSHVSFRAERFEYGGNGLELFLGFLIALAILGPPFLAIYVWIQLDPPIPGGDQQAFLAKIGLLYLAIFSLYLLTLYFTHVAIFAAYRYRLSRTMWHGIRATVEGNAWQYGFLGFGLSLLNGVSLGWTQPWAHVVLLNYRFSRTKVGTQPIHGEMDTKGLWGPFTLAWVLSFVAGILAIILITVMIAGLQGAANPRTFSDITWLILLVLAYLIVPVTWLITVNWYRAALLRKVAATYGFGGLKFSYPIGGGRLLWFIFSNAMILLLTLGLLYPYVILRYARLVVRYLRIEGEIDYRELRQSGDWRPSTGEGMAEFFGIGVV